jgi:hypothetical protein
VGGACDTCGGEEKSFRDMVEKSEVKISRGRPELKREDNAEMFLKEIKWDGLDCINVVQYSDTWRIVLTFGFHKIRDISRMLEGILAYRELLCFMEFSYLVN